MLTQKTNGEIEIRGIRKEEGKQQMDVPITDHTTFGGKIFFTDFDRKTTLAEVAEKIISDRKFDQQCIKNMEIRREWKKTCCAQQ